MRGDRCDVGEERRARRHVRVDEARASPRDHVGGVVPVGAAEVAARAVVVHVVVVVGAPVRAEPVVPPRGTWSRRTRLGTCRRARSCIPRRAGGWPRCLARSRGPCMLASRRRDRSRCPRPRGCGRASPSHEAREGQHSGRGTYALANASPPRRRGAGLGHVAQVVVAHVVGEDEDEVGFAGRRLGRGFRFIERQNRQPTREQGRQGRRSQKQNGPTHPYHLPPAGEGETRRPTRNVTKVAYNQRNEGASHWHRTSQLSALFSRQARCRATASGFLFGRFLQATW